MTTHVHYTFLLSGFIYPFMEAVMITCIGLLLALLLGTDITGSYLFFLWQIIVALWITSITCYRCCFYYHLIKVQILL